MPTVKTYGDPKVQQQAAPNARMAGQRVTGADPDAFGAVQARQSFMVGKQLDQIAEGMARRQEVDDATEVFDKKNKFREGLLTIQQQAKERQGTNAKGVTEWADAEIAKLRDTYLGELKNDRQKGLFAQDAESMRIGARGTFMDYESQQLEAGLDDKWQASKELAVQQAKADPSSAGRIEAEIMRANQFQAARKGWEPEVLEAETRKDLTKMHGGILGTLLDSDNLGGAQEYLKQHGQKMDPEVVARAEKWIKDKAFDSYSSQVVDQLIAEGKTHGEALQMITENYKGEGKDKLMAKARDKYGDIAVLKREQLEDMNDRFTKQAHKNGADSLSQAEIDKMIELDPQQGVKWQEAYNQAKAVKLSGGAHPDLSIQDKLIEASEAVESGKAVRAEDLAVFKSSLSSKDYERLTKEIERRKEIGPDELMNAYRIYLPQDKQNKNNWSLEDRIQYEKFKIMAEEGVRDKADKKEAVRFARDFFTPGKIKGSGVIFDDKTTKGQALLSGQIDKFIPGEAPPAVFSDDAPAVPVGKIVKQNGKRYRFDGKNYIEVQ